MQNVILVIHLLLALSLIGIVLMQRSEGGGLGIGGGTSVNTAVRSAASALAKVTWGAGDGFCDNQFDADLYRGARCE